MISERAEAIVVAVPAEDWPRVYAYIKDIENTWQGYKRPTVTPPPEPRAYPAGMLFGDLDAALARLKDGAAVQDAERTLQAAGEVSGAVGALVGFANPTRPSDVHRLAVLEREVLANAARDDLIGVYWNLDSVRRTWDRVRPTVLARADATVVQGFEEVLTAQQAALQAGNLPRVASLAGTALQLIHGMQQLNYQATSR
jgi:hypothetical protein